jgi:glycine cleavage system aminomethyltransferase T
MEAGLQIALDFDKGCYVGQEVVAKIDSLGHVNRRLVGLRIKGDTPPEAGASLYEEKKKVGHLTSAVLSPQSGEIAALGYVHRKCANLGYALETEVDGRRLPATVVIAGPSEAAKKN